MKKKIRDKIRIHMGTEGSMRAAVLIDIPKRYTVEEVQDMFIEVLIDGKHEVLKETLRTSIIGKVHTQFSVDIK